MPITGTPPAASAVYFPLVPGVGHLKNIGPLAASASGGLTSEDLHAAASYAHSAVDAALGNLYDTGGWPGATPAIIARVAELLGSAEVLDFKHARIDPGASSPYADSLRAEARFLITEIRSGRLKIITPDGTVLPRLARRPNIERS
jgi:hypothetical protein